MNAMRTDLAASSWPQARWREAAEALLRATAAAPGPVATPAGAADQHALGDEALGAWLGYLASGSGVEVEPVESSYAEAEALVARAGPALLRLAIDGEPRFLALLAGSRRRVTVLAPDLRQRRLPTAIAVAALRAPLAAPLLAEVDRLLGETALPPRRQARARAALLGQRLGGQPLAGCWLLRPRPQSAFAAQLRGAGLRWRLGGLIAVHAAQYLLFLLSWWLVGKAALAGRLDRGWLLAWALLLLTLVPLQLLVTWLQGALALGGGALLRRRLLLGALRLPPEEVRRQGAGQLLGRVVESETLESLALGGGLLALVAAVELVLAAAVLGLGAGGWPSTLLLVGWVVVALALAWQLLRRRRRWTAARMQMTHDLVEGMVGHRTRLAQEERGAWHVEEDAALARYLDVAAPMDRTATLLLALVPRGWLLLGLLALAPGFVAGTASPAALAVSIGGMLLAYRALRRLVLGVSQLAGAAIAWDQVAPLFHAATAAREADGVPAPVGRAVPATVDRPALVEARDLVFRHQERSDPVLRGCSLRIDGGERVLLQGPSGGGKSTFAALLAGLRLPGSGLLLVDGLDHHSLGAEAWRRRVAAAPQFHENHVLSGTFAFNALMGRRWPPTPADLAEAQTVCRGLGLGPLLERMPAGLLQMVGENGWQLSHGERSRLFIARALLQGAGLVLLDESFAALDPENLQQALRYVLGRADALLVVAHP